jgi:hypothetical protein
MSRVVFRENSCLAFEEPWLPSQLAAVDSDLLLQIFNSNAAGFIDPSGQKQQAKLQSTSRFRYRRLLAAMKTAELLHATPFDALPFVRPGFPRSRGSNE